MANLSVSYEDMRSAATRLTQGESDVNAKLKELQSFIQGLVSSGFVTDSASKSFESTYQQFTQGATQTMSALEGLSSYLTKAAQTLQDTDAQLAAGLN